MTFAETPGGGLSREELRLQRVVAAFGLLFLVLALSYVVQGIFGPAEFPFVANSVTKDGLFAALCIVAANDIRRSSWAVFVVIAGHVLLISALLAMLAAGDISNVAGSFGDPGTGMPPAETLLFIWLGLAVFVTVLLALLYRSAARARYRLRYLPPLAHRTLMALAEVLVMGDDELLSPEEVAEQVDDYLASFAAREKWKSKLALTALAFYPLLRLRPPYPVMSPERRREFVEQRFVRDIAERRLPGPLRRPVQSMFFAAQQLCFIGYYGDSRTAAGTGYVPFSERPGYEQKLERVERDRASVVARSPGEIDAERVTADVVVVGSGAGGATIAERLAAGGREVLILERGRHVDPSEFTENESSQFSLLFADGGLQMSQDARFQVLQGMCVGGTTVVNNAVCFEPPQRVLDRWNDPDGLDAGIDERRLRESVSRLRGSLPVRDQSHNGHLGPGGAKFADGVKRLRLDHPPGRFGVVEANIEDCLGCGYCNIGCRYGKKLSMLDTTLPQAQRRFGTDAVRVFCECDVERIEHRGGRATGVRCRLSDGRTLEVAANTVVVAAGALHSSLLLQRSGIGGAAAGRNLCFNVGAPMTGDFDDKVNAYDGLQISHYLQPPGEQDLILETWFNPVGAQSLFMPGWFSDHYSNMRRYDHMACAGSVIGTRRNASVRPKRFGRGMKLSYTPAKDDLNRLVRGLKLVGRIFLAAGATRVMPTTYRYLQFDSPEQLDELDELITDNTDIQLSSSHPQGGNAVSRDPKKGVVDPSLRVHGFENLHVADASVFPSALTVNPQLTVMAFADYARDAIE